MKTSKIIFALAVAVIFVVIPVTIFSQTEKLDIIEYTPPKGCAKTLKQSVTISMINEAGSWKLDDIKRPHCKMLAFISRKCQDVACFADTY